MDDNEFVNCYCFNPGCPGSIFMGRAFSAIRITLLRALTEEIYCAECGSELISRPLLEIRTLLSDSFDTHEPDIAI